MTAQDDEMGTPRALCMTCESFIGWVDCPTGGWWAHEVHPLDGHDAVRMPVPPAPDPLGYRPTTPAEIRNSVDPGAWKDQPSECVMCGSSASFSCSSCGTCLDCAWSPGRRMTVDRTGCCEAMKASWRRKLSQD